MRFEFERMLQRLRLAPTTKLVALMLATYATGSSGGNAHPGEDRLAADCGLSKRTVRTHLALLRDAGLIRRASKGRANQYSRTADLYQLCLPPDVGSEVGLTQNHPALASRRNGMADTGSNEDRAGLPATTLGERQDLLAATRGIASGDWPPHIKDVTKDVDQPLTRTAPFGTSTTEGVASRRGVGHTFESDGSGLTCVVCHLPQRHPTHQGAFQNLL